MPIDEAELLNRFRMMIARANKDVVYAASVPVELMSIVKLCKAQAVTAALKRVDEGLPKLLTEQLYEDIKREYPDLDKTDYFHFGLDQAHQAITNELSKWEKK